MASPLAVRIASWATEVAWSDVPGPDRELIELRILDTLGLVLAALESPQAHAVLALIEAQGGRDECALLGTQRRAPAAWAALAHATLAHSLDFDDTLVDSVVHPGSVVVPTAFAAAEATGASGEALRTAIAVGYEVAARLGAPAGRELHARGFHASGIIGPLAAAVTAAKLYGLAPAAMASAMGLAGSMSAGLLEFLADGSWSKWLHLGWAAHGGVVAAQLGARGFRGPKSVLDGRFGLYRSFLGRAPEALEAAAVDLGREWRSRAARFKYYPCAHVIQPFIDAALELKRTHALAVADIAEVRCAVAPWCVALVCEPRAAKIAPKTELDAIASLPFMVATALATGEVTLSTINELGRTNAAALTLAERVRHDADPEFSDFDGRIAVRTSAGALLERSAHLTPIDAAKVRAKFRSNAAHRFDAARIVALEQAAADPSCGAQRLAALCKV